MRSNCDAFFLTRVRGFLCAPENFLPSTHISFLKRTQFCVHVALTTLLFRSNFPFIVLRTCVYTGSWPHIIFCARAIPSSRGGSAIEIARWRCPVCQSRDLSDLSVCTHLSSHNVVRGGGHNVMEKLSRPEKETCDPPSLCHGKIELPWERNLYDPPPLTMSWKSWATLINLCDPRPPCYIMETVGVLDSEKISPSARKKPVWPLLTTSWKLNVGGLDSENFLPLSANKLVWPPPPLTVSWKLNIGLTKFLAHVLLLSGMHMHTHTHTHTHTRTDATRRATQCQGHCRLWMLFLFSFSKSRGGKWSKLQTKWLDLLK